MEDQEKVEALHDQLNFKTKDQINRKSIEQYYKVYDNLQSNERLREAYEAYFGSVPNPPLATLHGQIISGDVEQFYDAYEVLQTNDRLREAYEASYGSLPTPP